MCLKFFEVHNIILYILLKYCRVTGYLDLEILHIIELTETSGSCVSPVPFVQL